MTKTDSVGDLREATPCGERDNFVKFLDEKNPTEFLSST